MTDTATAAATGSPGRSSRWLWVLGLGVPMLPVLGVVTILAVLGLMLAGGSDGAGVGGTGTGLKSGTVPPQYEAAVLAAGALCPAAPPAIIAAQIEQESGWDPTAVSPAGAEGISQFMPSTWPSWSQPDQSPFDPAAAIPAQGKYDCALATQMAQAQTAGKLPTSLPLTDLMLAAYNAGPFAVITAGGIPQNGQTPSYVARITAGAATYADTTGTGLTSDDSTTSSALGAWIVAAATSQIGAPYAWAGGTYTGPTLGVCAGGDAANDCHIAGYDCSGLVMFAAYQASNGQIKLPHSADAQPHTSHAAIIIDQTQLQPGDLISFTDPGSSTAHHIGIYVGGMRIVDAPESGTLVRVDSLTTAYYQRQQWTMARLA